jgi:hypothetical protein
MVQRVPPVVRKPTGEGAIYILNWVSATGSGILVAAIISGLIMGFTPWKMAHIYWQTIARVRFSLLTIAAMLSAISHGIPGWTPPWAWRSREPECCIPSSARCWDGWAWR